MAALKWRGKCGLMNVSSCLMRQAMVTTSAISMRAALAQPGSQLDCPQAARSQLP